MRRARRRAFRQHADRNRAPEAELRGAIGDVRDESLDVGCALGFRQREERDAVAGAVQEHVDLRLPRGVMHVVHARTTREKRLSSLPMSPAISAACARSLPMGAPSSQSQEMSNTGPRSACSASALRMNFSLPA
jgi:hypothetical protein